MDKKGNANWHVSYTDEDLENTFSSRYQEVRLSLIPIYNSFFMVPRDENGIHIPSEQELVLTRELELGEDEETREFTRTCWHAMLQEWHRVHKERQDLMSARSKESRK